MRMVLHTQENKKTLKISGVRPLDDYMLWARFSTGEAKVFDFKTLLDMPAFSPLRDKKTFEEVYIDYGVAVWNDGEIDIAPEYLYKHGELC